MTELRFSIADTEARRIWDKMLCDLESAGWPVERKETGARVGSVSLSQTAGDGPAPDGWTVLRALGAGGMERALAGSIPKGVRVDRVLVTLNWTMVRAGALCGIARSPARDTEGARTIRPEGGFINHELHDLAALLCQTDPLARSLGLAAVNAWWNRPGAKTLDKGGFAAMEPPGDGVVIIGGFRSAQQRLPHAQVVEREPKPGDIPADEAGPAIRAARILAITAQTIVNGSLPPLLHSAGNGPRKVLIGPSAPFCPLLFDHGIDEISAITITNPDAAERFICETGTMIMRDDMARSIYMQNISK